MEELGRNGHSYNITEKVHDKAEVEIQMTNLLLKSLSLRENNAVSVIFILLDTHKDI